MLQRGALRLIQQGGQIIGFNIKGAGGQCGRPLLLGLLQARLFILQTAGQGLTATGQLLLTALHLFQLSLRLLQGRLRIGGLGQGRLIGEVQRSPALLPVLSQLNGSLQGVIQLTELALQIQTLLLIALPTLPLSLALGEPDAGILRQLVAKLGKGLTQIGSTFSAILRQLLQTMLTLLALLLTLLQVQKVKRLLLFQFTAALLQI